MCVTRAEIKITSFGQTFFSISGKVIFKKIMTTKSFIEKLNKAIIERKSADVINGYADVIVENIIEASSEPLFYSLPIEQISTIIKKVEFANKDEINDPIPLLQTLIQKTSEIHNEDAVLLLNGLKIDNLPSLLLDDIIGIVSKFTKCELLTKLGELYIEEKSLLRPDFSFMIKQLEGEVTKLNQEIEEKDKKLNALDMKLLPKKKLKITYSDIDIFEACRQDKLENVQYLWEVQKVNPETRTNGGWTPLHIACMYNHLDIVRYLCEIMKADTRARNDYGETPLHTACSNGSLLVARYLCENLKVFKEPRDKWGKTPYYWAKYNKRTDVVKYLESIGVRK